METFSREASRLDPWFVTGFAEGQGSFTFSRSSGTIAIYFAIKVNSSDQGILARIRAFFDGAGRIYSAKPAPPGHVSGHSKRSAYYRTTKLADLERIVEHFDTYPLQGEKRRAYSLWRRMFELKKRTFRRPDLGQLEALARKLSDASPRSRPRKPPAGDH